MNTNLRQVFKIEGTNEHQIRMSELREGDHFRLESDDMADHINKTPNTIYIAVSDPKEIDGNSSIEVEYNNN